MSVARPEPEGGARSSPQARSRSPDYAWASATGSWPADRSAPLVAARATGTRRWSVSRLGPTVLARIARATSMLRAVLASLVLLVLVACQDAAGPTRGGHDIVGRYVLTAQFDSYSYQDAIGCTSLYCTHTVPASGTALTGALVVEDTVVAAAGRTRLPHITGAFVSERCGAEPRDCGDGTLAFRSYGLVYPDEPTYVDAVAPDGTVAMLLTRGAAEQWIRLDGRLTSDRISGTITWLPSVPRRSYTGTFVATR